MGETRLFGGERGLERTRKSEPESSEMASSELTSLNAGKMSKTLLELLLLLLSKPLERKYAWSMTLASDMSGMAKDTGEAKKSSRSVVRSVTAEDADPSAGERRFGKGSEERPGVANLGGGLITPGEVRGPVPELVDLVPKPPPGRGFGWVTLMEVAPEGEKGSLVLSLILNRLLCFRPARFVAMYSQGMPRFVQREHVGFSLWHFNLEDAQAWQLSRNLGAAGAVARRPVEDEEVS